jgi:hypothetical protein
MAQYPRAVPYLQTMQGMSMQRSCSCAALRINPAVTSLKGLTDSEEILKARKVALDGLIQLEDFAGLGEAERRE